MNSEILSPASDPLELVLEELLEIDDEAGLDPTWSRAQREVKAFTLRPAKRLRPKLLSLGVQLSGARLDERAVMKFGAALELLHTFLLVHDDVADHAALRRGGATLHEVLRSDGPGTDLAVVAGDHLFARAMELMLSTGLERAPAAMRYLLGVCRHTAAGQYLDLAFAKRALSEVSPFDALKVARLKTADYSFAAPLVCGALLGGGSPELCAALSRFGRSAGLAFQLGDDLIGAFAEDGVEGKSGVADLAEGKRTFPLLIAWRKATEGERRVLESLGEGGGPETFRVAREIIVRRGGVRATQRAIERYWAAGLRALDGVEGPAVETLKRMAGKLVHRPVRIAVGG